MNDEREPRESLLNFLNPDVLRHRLVTAGLFIIAHELLLRAVRTPLLEFFSSSWTSKTGWVESAAYKENVRNLDPKGRFDALRGSLEWLTEHQVIAPEDKAKVLQITDARNDFAHELGRIVSGSGKLPDFALLFPQVTALILKIERWWIFNVHLPADDEYNSNDVTLDTITPGSMVFLQILELVALGDEGEAWELYRQFTANDRESQ